MGKYSVLAVAIIIIASGPAWASKIIGNGHCVIDYDWNASNFLFKKPKSTLQVPRNLKQQLKLSETDIQPKRRPLWWRRRCQIANDGRASHSYRALKTGSSITAKENRSSGGVS